MSSPSQLKGIHEKKCVHACTNEKKRIFNWMKFLLCLHKICNKILFTVPQFYQLECKVKIVFIRIYKIIY